MQMIKLYVFSRAARENTRRFDKFWHIEALGARKTRRFRKAFLDESKDEKGMYEKDAPAAQRQEYTFKMKMKHTCLG